MYYFDIFKVLYIIQFQSTHAKCGAEDTIYGARRPMGTPTRHPIGDEFGIPPAWA